MRKAVQNLISEMEGKMSGYAALMFYRLLNLPVKAEPASLLPLDIRDDEGGQYTIESAAYVFQPNEQQLEIIPKLDNMIFAIGKALLDVHPEYKQEVITAEEENRIDSKDEEEKHILITAPPVNKDRHDVLMDAVDALYKECMTNLDKTKGIYKAKLAEMVVNQPPEDGKEGDDAIDQTYKTHKEMVDGYRTNKEKEIEDAYQKYLAQQQSSDMQQKEQDAAHDKQAGLSMKFNLGNDD